MAKQEKRLFQRERWLVRFIETAHSLSTVSDWSGPGVEGRGGVVLIVADETYATRNLPTGSDWLGSKEKKELQVCVQRRQTSDQTWRAS